VHSPVKDIGVHNQLTASTMTPIVLRKFDINVA